MRDRIRMSESERRRLLAAIAEIEAGEALAAFEGANVERWYTGLAVVDYVEPHRRQATELTVEDRGLLLRLHRLVEESAALAGEAFGDVFDRIVDRYCRQAVIQ